MAIKHKTDKIDFFHHFPRASLLEQKSCLGFFVLIVIGIDLLPSLVSLFKVDLWSKRRALLFWKSNTANNSKQSSLHSGSTRIFIDLQRIKKWWISLIKAIQRRHQINCITSITSLYIASALILQQVSCSTETSFDSRKAMFCECVVFFCD